VRALLAHAPGTSGVLFDLPEVVAAPAGSLEDAAGPPIETVGGSFFDGVPVGADLYLLAHVLCDWDDAAAATIVRNCHRAAGRIVCVKRGEEIRRECPGPTTRLLMASEGVWAGRQWR
jgi:hypothetical protein